MGWVRRGAVAAGALVAMTGGVLAGAIERSDPVLLPDLREVPPGCHEGSAPGMPCTDWDICMVEDPNTPSGECLKSGPINAVRIRFTSSVDNIGDGPLVVYGNRGSARSSTMAVRQAFQAPDSGPIPSSFAAAQHGIDGSMYYEPSASHMHWHYLDFEHFALRTPTGETVVTDRKNGFCLGDRYTVFDTYRIRNAVRAGTNTPQAALSEFLTTNNCRHQEPSALDVTEGISVGKGDHYNYDVDYQWLDITNVPSGQYNLVATANPNRQLRELNYDNNSASIAISIRWPNGSADSPITKPPAVSVIRRCPGSDRCVP